MINFLSSLDQWTEVNVATGVFPKSMWSYRFWRLWRENGFDLLSVVGWQDEAHTYVKNDDAGLI